MSRVPGGDGAANGGGGAGRLRRGPRTIMMGMKSAVHPAASAARERWEREVRDPALHKSPERPGAFTTVSGRPIEALYTPDDVADIDYARHLGDPGVFPYTRGIHPSGYRGKLWTMRQFAGFGTPEETNERYKATARAPAAPA